MQPVGTPAGDQSREAIDSLRGYVYQIYQSALAWTELGEDGFLFLEIAEDFSVVAANALEAVQVKETAGRITINSDDVVASIDSFVQLREKNPNLDVSLRHLTTSAIGKEQKSAHRVNDVPTLTAWRSLAKTGDLSEFRTVLGNSKLSKTTKDFVSSLDDSELRDHFLKKIHFDCGAPDSRFLAKQLNSRVSKLVMQRGGVHSQAADCTASMVLSLLRLATTKNRDERVIDRNGLEELLERATQVVLNRADFEEQSRLMTRAISAAVPSSSELSNTRIATPKPVSEVPLPRALASRKSEIDDIARSLEHFGMSWVSGAAGMGKTVAARVAALRTGGNWASINLKGLKSEQVAPILSDAAVAMHDYDLQGILLDDLECRLDTHVSDSLHYLLHSADRLDVLTICTAPNAPPSDFLFTADLPQEVIHKLTEFSEEDIGEILEKLGVKETYWANYVHLISGGGHPQLAIAAIQSLSGTGWDPEEFKTLNAVLVGSPEVDEVRRRTRERLLDELSVSSRRLIERLSLKTGSFKRELAIDLAKISPSIPDAGIVMDRLIGSWVDQQEGDRFHLSPLLSNYAAKTLSNEDKESIQSVIAVSLTKGRSLDVSDMNAALLAAWSSQNTAVIVKICMAIFGAEHDELEIIAPHMSMFTLFRTDTSAYPSEPAINQMFRGAQLILLNQESDRGQQFSDALICFEREALQVEDASIRTSMSMLVYSKILLQTSKAGLGNGFLELISKLNKILENEDNTLPSEMVEHLAIPGSEGVEAIGFMFLNQSNKISKIRDLLAVFDYLDRSPPALREKLLRAFHHDDFEIDMLVNSAWLREHDADTIDASTHVPIFARLEEYATSWGQAELAVCCRKLQAIILDEYGSDKDGALALLDEGLQRYGSTNSELVRAKAKVLYRSDDHKGSLELSKTLIEGDAPLSDVEKAFLGRDAGISAENERDFETARRYYLFGSAAAEKSDLPDMTVMGVGLLADAAIASWHAGDRKTCLQDFVAVLTKMQSFEPDESLRAANCHAIARHVLLWLDHDATGKDFLLDGGESARIFPGCVSNPDPNKDVTSKPLLPIEMAWYMLATIENNALLNVGITENIGRFLPKGPLIEGQMFLISAKMHSALARLDNALFVDALQDKIAYYAYVQSKGAESPDDGIQFNYGQIPAATKEQQIALIELAEQLVLLYSANSILRNEVAEISSLVPKIFGSSSFTVRPNFLNRLQCDGPTEDFYMQSAKLIFLENLVLKGDDQGTPHQAFELAFKVLQIAHSTRNLKLFAENLIPWLRQRWDFVWDRQRFLLSDPALHGDAIKAAFEQDGVPAQKKVVEILSSMLPTLGHGNQSELERILGALPKQ
jgi:ABC-type oligopeptide transport system ATPase subunit